MTLYSKRFGVVPSRPVTFPEVALLRRFWATVDADAVGFEAR
jgi:hypothetical protein